MNKLYTTNITKSYENKCIIKDINIELKENELVSLLGISGVGKSTIFNILSGILSPDNGKVFLNNIDVTGNSGKIAYMLQKDLLLPYKTIIDNIALPLIIKGKSKTEAYSIVNKYFKQFGLENTEKKYPSQLSRRDETTSSITKNIYV